MVRNSLIYTVKLLFLLSSTSCSSFQKENFTVKTAVVYKTIDGVDMTGDIFDPAVSGLRPAVIVTHGGGWARHSGDMVSVSKQLANAGYVVFNIKYRLAPKNHFPAPVEDVRNAILWLRENAKNYNIDPDRIGGWGYSAGANVLLLAVLDGKLGVKAIVAGGTPADLTMWPKSPLVLDYIGAPLQEKPEQWKAASPVYQVTDQSPPVFLYHGDWDRIVEPEQMTKMETALTAQNRVVKTYRARFHGHITVYLWSQDSVDRGLEFLKENL